MDDDTTIEPTPTDELIDELAEDDMAQEVIDLESQRRLWLRAIIPLLSIRSHDTDPSDRVQFAVDLMHIAACERVVRLMHSDEIEGRGQCTGDGNG
jgi:hypothetical protein